MAFKHILGGLLMVALVSCSASQKAGDNGNNNGSSKDEVAFTGTIQTHKPYCGGARPTPEMEKGFTDPVPNADFYIYSGDRPENKKDMIKVTTNEQGVFTVQLIPGEYHIVQAQKLLPLEEFIKNNTYDSQHYQQAPEPCFRDWKDSPDFSFKLEGESKEVFTENHRCFIGANPCLKYVGPYPP